MAIIDKAVVVRELCKRLETLEGVDGIVIVHPGEPIPGNAVLCLRIDSIGLNRPMRGAMQGDANADIATLRFVLFGWVGQTETATKGSYAAAGLEAHVAAAFRDWGVEADNHIIETKAFSSTTGEGQIGDKTFVGEMIVIEGDVWRHGSSGLAVIDPLG